MNKLTNNRWWIYQQERFPVFVHGPLVLVFALALMLFSSLQHDEIPEFYRIAGAAISALIFFFQLRVADEHKDFHDDARWRPHRAVPRGLVALPELSRLAIAGAFVQFAIAISIDIGLVPILFGVWLYIGLMTVEFFVPHWLKRTPSAYLVSHMVVMPLIAFYISAFDWLCECRELPAGLGWVLALAFFCGLVLELGRKIRTPADEREGVETYSAVWGSRNSILVWLLSVVLSAAAYEYAIGYVSDSIFLAGLGFGVIAFAGITAALFPRKGDGLTGSGKLIEPSSGLMAMILYLGLGPIQLLMA